MGMTGIALSGRPEETPEERRTKEQEQEFFDKINMIYGICLAAAMAGDGRRAREEGRQFRGGIFCRQAALPYTGVQKFLRRNWLCGQNNILIIVIFCLDKP